MEIEFITDNKGETIINSKTNEIVSNVQQAKYLSKLINEHGVPGN